MKKFKPKLTSLRNCAKRLVPNKDNLTTGILIEMNDRQYYRLKAIELLKSARNTMELEQAGQLIVLELAHGAFYSENETGPGS